jgi:O-antigen ligase
MFTPLNWKDVLYIDPLKPRRTRREQAAGWAEGGVFVCLGILATLLPYSEITTSREIGLFGGLFFWSARMILDRRFYVTRTPLDIPLGLFLLTALLSVFSAIDPGYTLHEIRGEIIRNILIFYLAVNNIKTNFRAQALIGALIVGLCLMNFYGVSDYFAQGGSFIETRYELTSFHSSTPELWTYLIQTAPYLILAMIFITHRQLRFFLAIVLVLHVSAVYMTWGRAALMVLVLEAALILFILRVSWKFILLGFLVLVLSVAFFHPKRTIVVGENARDELNTAGVGIKDLKGVRFIVWSVAVKQIRESPLTGLGFGRRSLVKAYPQVLEYDYWLWHAHNTFLSIAVELGIQGLIVFIWMLITIMIYLWPGRGTFTQWRQDGTHRPILAATIIMMIAYFTLNLTNDLYANDQAQLFWLLVGVGFSVKRFILDGQTRPDGGIKKCLL